jgi:cytochrome P450
VEAEVRLALAEFDEEFLRPSVARRRALLACVAAGELDEQALPRDVLTVILQAEEELALDDQQLLREIAFYMQAGAHSTAHSVVHALHEITQWAGEDAGRWSRLEDPTFVHRCVHESLRLHPASPEAWRTATCPMSVAGAGDMATGNRVVLDLFTANRDEQIFGDTAQIFDPDREIPRGVMPAGLAFGIGMHTCLGRELDGGVAAKPGSDPSTHQFGIVPLLVIRLLQLGARPDPEGQPEMDAKTVRPNWGRYPIIFTGAQA